MNKPGNKARTPKPVAFVPKSARAFGDSAWLVAKKYLPKKKLENKAAIKHAIVVPVSEAELDWLVAKKYLAEEEREK